MKQANDDKALRQKIFQLQAEICKALGNPTRMAIVDRLGVGEIAAADLIAGLGISKANLSKHMTILVHGGIVESRRDGRQILYRLIDSEIRKACAVMSSVLYRRLKRGERLASAIDMVKAS
ncbi:MAG: transcriptional regulator, ArsR family [Acidobacteria bacterium]|nr:transcriptional regulator, ArsR family [Acidobacteriota bacterium]